MRKGFIFYVVLIFVILSRISGAGAEEKAVRLDEIIVTGKKLVTPTKQTNETVYTGSRITKKGIDAQGSKANTSIYEAVRILPGVSVESADAYGIAAEQKNIRIRGVRGYLGAMTVEGIPNYGGNPMGPREYIYDTENIESIDVYKGAVPADLGTGVGARGGAVEITPRWPEHEFGIDLGQSIGGDNYNRTFLRLDTGTLPGVNSLFGLSFSHAHADKWKGPGDLGPRNNGSIMLTHPLSGDNKIKVWFNYNDMKQNLYRPLTYSETRDLDKNYRKDYNDSMTGIRKEDINYYKYNRGNYSNKDFLSMIPIRFSDALSLTFKPYYSRENSDIFNGSGSGGGIIIKRTRDISRYGAISQVDSDWSGLKASAGYWFESLDMEIRTRKYEPESFTFKGYGMYSENKGKGYVHSPYFKLSGMTDKIDWQVGGKYFYYKEPASSGYISTGPAHELTRAFDLDRKEKTYDAFLPSLGASIYPLDCLEFYASYGRNQIRPYAYMPLVNIYNQNRNKFQESGITIDDLFNGYDMEISDNFELGCRFWKKGMEIMPVFFFSKHKNLLTTVYDPRVGVSYYQNVGSARGYGMEVETNFYWNNNLILFANPSYTVLSYDNDMTYQNNTMDTKGKQIVDTPKFSMKTGAIFSWNNFEIISKIRYLSKRYGDAEHKERIDDYIVADLKTSYKVRNLFFTKSLKLSMEINNIFNRKYISVINAMDDTREGMVSYYSGAPFSILFGVSMEI